MTLTKRGLQGILKARGVRKGYHKLYKRPPIYPPIEIGMIPVGRALRLFRATRLKNILYEKAAGRFQTGEKKTCAREYIDCYRFKQSSCVINAYLRCPNSRLQRGREMRVIMQARTKNDVPLIDY